VKAVFVELPAFERYRADYLDENGFGGLQDALMSSPTAGDLGGLRKVRYSDQRRGKGKRGGLRVIYYWWESGAQFWLFTLYDKDEVDDLSPGGRKILKERLKRELALRSR